MPRTVRAFVALLCAISASGQTPPDFTGHWLRQTNAGDQRGLNVDQTGDRLRVETTVTNSKGTRHLEVTYQIGGPEIVYKGLDGDEFHTRAHWDGSDLVFDTIEHERGRTIPETEVWSLSEDRNSLLVKRQSAESAKTSAVTYLRQPDRP